MHFETAFKYTILNEGRFDNDPTDRGGETHWGITVGAAAIHRCEDHPQGIKIKDVDLKVARHIYLLDYWKFSAISDLAVAVKLFDFGVNFHPTVATRLAQRAINKMGGDLIADGIFGAKTAAAINSMPSLRFIDYLETEASDYYCDIVINDFKKQYGISALNKMQLKFLKGWMRRLNKRFYNDVPLTALGDEQ